MPSSWTRERRRRPASALLAGLLVGAVLLTGCYGVDYRYLARGGGGAPVAQRCGPMPFRINPHGAAGEWQLVAVVRAAQRLESVTGVDWRFQGYTNERIATGFDPRLHGGRVASFAANARVLWCRIRAVHRWPSADRQPPVAPPARGLRSGWPSPAADCVGQCGRARA